MKHEVITFRLSKPDKTKLQLLANEKMVPMGTYVRKLVERNIERSKS